MKYLLKPMVILGILACLASCRMSNDFIIDCHKSGCPLDSAFCSDFKKAFIDIQDRDHETELGLMQDAVFYLSTVTGRRAHVIDIHTPVYASEVTLRQDLELWHQWFESNGCYTRKVFADSLVRIARGR
jgi:hypothetical protein